MLSRLKHSSSKHALTCLLLESSSLWKRQFEYLFKEAARPFLSHRNTLPDNNAVLCRISNKSVPGPVWQEWGWCVIMCLHSVVTQNKVKFLAFFYDLWVFLETWNTMKLKRVPANRNDRVHLKPCRADRRLHNGVLTNLCGLESVPLGWLIISGKTHITVIPTYQQGIHPKMPIGTLKPQRAQKSIQFWLLLYMSTYDQVSQPGTIRISNNSNKKRTIITTYCNQSFK